MCYAVSDRILIIDGAVLSAITHPTEMVYVTTETAPVATKAAPITTLIKREFYKPLSLQATVYTLLILLKALPDLTPSPFPSREGEPILKAPLRIGEGYGERSADLCVHRSLAGERFGEEFSK
ncbi:hypothetical protein WKK05_24185 [Nostoc sp. UHCC 0302]|uniref:hypothetical protein n=1 Tax=Nostoc sp. UHCC 0302 TaxID=3134896 RepID=UPI00311CDFE5